MRSVKERFPAGDTHGRLRRLHSRRMRGIEDPAHVDAAGRVGSDNLDNSDVSSATSSPYRRARRRLECHSAAGLIHHSSDPTMRWPRSGDFGEMPDFRSNDCAGCSRRTRRRSLSRRLTRRSSGWSGENTLDGTTWTPAAISTICHSSKIAGTMRRRLGSSSNPVRPRLDGKRSSLADGMCPAVREGVGYHGDVLLLRP